MCERGGGKEGEWVEVSGRSDTLPGIQNRGLMESEGEE